MDTWVFEIHDFQIVLKVFSWHSLLILHSSFINDIMFDFLPTGSRRNGGDIVAEIFLLDFGTIVGRGKGPVLSPRCRLLSASSAISFQSMCFPESTLR